MRIFTTLFAGTLISISCLAQTSTGRIAGSVIDQSGATIRGAVVIALDERTNRERTTSSNEDGNFAISGLEPSNYTLRASQSGFSPAEVRNLPLQVGQEIRRSLKLSVSNTSSVIEVHGGAIDAIDASDAKIGVNVTGREVAELPLNGRQVSQLYLLTPGAVNSGRGTYDNIRFSGRSNQQNIIRYDGIEATFRSFPGSRCCCSGSSP